MPHSIGAPMKYSARHLRSSLLLLLLLSSLSSLAAVRETQNVVSAIDGDTVIFGTGEHARLIGIDTPERNQQFYSEAKEYLASLVEGKQVNIHYDKETRDQYGRLLIYMNLETGEFVNEEMIHSGLAKVYSFAPNFKHHDHLVEIQRESIEAKRGLWETEPKGEEEYYVGNAKTLRFHRPDAKEAKGIKNPVKFPEPSISE